MEIDAVAFANVMSLLNGVFTQFCNTFVHYTGAVVEVLIRTQCDLFWNVRGVKILFRQDCYRVLVGSLRELWVLWNPNVGGGGITSLAGQPLAASSPEEICFTELITEWHFSQMLFRNRPLLVAWSLDLFRKPLCVMKSRFRYVPSSHEPAGWSWPELDEAIK
jgi:hypothetical protein